MVIAAEIEADLKAELKAIEDSKLVTTPHAEPEDKLRAAE